MPSKKKEKRISNGKTRKKRYEEPPEQSLLAPVQICFVYYGRIPWGQYEILANRVRERGAKMSKDVTLSCTLCTTHIVSSSWTSVVNSPAYRCVCCLNRLKENVWSVSWDWVSACLIAKKLVVEQHFRLDMDGEVKGQLERWQDKNGYYKSNGQWVYLPNIGQDRPEVVNNVIVPSIDPGAVIPQNMCNWCQISPILLK